MALARLDRARSPSESGALQRLRWRRRGAWLWPTFIAATIADGAIGAALPPQGDSQSAVGLAIVAGVINLVAIVLLTRPLAAAVRRVRPELPMIVARDYAGRVLILGITAALLIAGLVHRPTVQQHQRTMRDAIVRAQAWIGDRAPSTFRRNVQFVSTFTIEPGWMFRMCVPSQDGRRTYCVIVNTNLPLQHSVRFDGYEPNTVFAQGTG